MFLFLGCSAVTQCYSNLPGLDALQRSKAFQDWKHSWVQATCFSVPEGGVPHLCQINTAVILS